MDWLLAFGDTNDGIEHRFVTEVYGHTLDRGLAAVR